MAKGAAKPPSQAAPTAKPEFNVDAYNDVVESAVLQTVQALKVNLDVSPEYYDETSERKYSVDRELIGVTFEPGGTAVAGTFRFAVNVKQGRARVLKASAEYFVLYGVHEGAEAAASEEFCRRVGIFAAYPYFRALMAQLSWEANAHLPIMPVIATRGSKLKALSPKE